MTTPIKGFMKVAEVLIRERPGLSAEDYAQIALDQGLAASNSKDPVQSLATTLMKQVREARVSTVHAEKVRGKLRFYPLDDLWNPPGRRLPDLLLTDVMLSPDAAARMKALVEIGKFPNELEAASWLVEEGIEANKKALDMIDAEVEEIRRRKKEAQSLI